MEGTFFITLEYLNKLGACQDSQRAFSAAFPEGGEYQTVLDRCAEEDKLDFANWLLSHVGPTSDIRTYESELNAPDKNIVFAGTLLFRKNVKVKSITTGGPIEAGWSIEAGESIRAGGPIEAGWFIEAGESIRAGGPIEAGESIKAGGAIEAGLSAPQHLKKQYAVVISKEKPQNLAPGVIWLQKE